MQITDISLWGVALMVVLMALAVALFLLIDRREMMRVLKVFGLTLGQMILAGVGVWLVYKVDAWWMDILWLLIMLALSGAWCLYEMKWQVKKLALPLAAALVAGCLVAGGSMMLTLPGRCFVSVFGVLLAYMITSITLTLQTYQRCLYHTESHRLYLQANGATKLESLMPGIRRALRASIQPQLRTMAQPLLVAMPLLFAGMLLGGASPVAGVFVLLLLMVAAFVASVVAGIVAVGLYSKLSC